MDELLESVRVDRLWWNAILHVENGQRPAAVLFERCSIVAELVQEDTKSPDVGFLVNDAALVYVDHLWRSILQGGVLIEVGFDSLDFIHALSWFAGKDGCGRSKIAELEGGFHVGRCGA